MYWALWWPETEQGGEISIDRPVWSCDGAVGAELRPIWPNIGRKNGGFGLGKWSREAISVDGCGRSVYRVVGLAREKNWWILNPKSLEI